MSVGLERLNDLRKPHCLDKRNAYFDRRCYPARMVARHYDWYLKDWLRVSGKKQADIVRDLDWNKARISLMVRGEQPYTRDAVNELANYLNLRPHELLMHPDDAMALRRLRQDALRVVETSQPVERTGTTD
jgi:hypothetical protein